MTHLVIRNQGLIEPGDLTLMGSSTKRDDDTKIGMYGSGNKYAHAWFLRNNIDVRIFSGLDEIVISHDLVKHRDRDVAVMTVNGEKTSITSEMGPEWTGWMALREVISNAIDEGDYEITTAFNCEIKGIENNTMIFIPLNNELNIVVRNYDFYFAFDRKASYENEYHGSIYLKTERSLQNIYRKGIRCYDEKELHSYLDWDLQKVIINESRTCSDYSKRTTIENFIAYSMLPSKVLYYAILDGILPNYWSENLEEPLKELIEQGHTMVTKSAQKLFGFIYSGKDVLIIPDSWYKKLVSKGLLKKLFERDDIDFIELHDYDIRPVKHYLNQLGLIDMEVLFGKFNSSAHIGYSGGGATVYLNENCRGIEPKNLAVKILQYISEDYLADNLFRD